MRLLAVLMTAGLAASATGNERITREEIIEDMVRSIKFDLCCDETISEAERESIRKAMLQQAAKEDFLPEVVENLPNGTRAAVLGHAMLLSSKEPEYCLARAECHLMQILAQCECARKMPLLGDTQQRDFVGTLDGLLATTGTAIKNYLEPLLQSDEIDRWMEKLRAHVIATMQSPVSNAFKRIPAASDVDRITAGLEQRLAGVRQQEFEEARRRWPGWEFAPYGAVSETFRQRVFTDAIGFVWQALSDCTSIQEPSLDSGPFFARFDSVRRRVNEMEYREIEKARAWRASHFRREIEKYVAERLKAAGPGAPEPPPLSPPARGWEVKIELPASRPATQPSGPSAAATQPAGGGGHLYQGRFRSFPVQRGAPFLAVCRYVERNARTAGVVKRAEQWRFGSLGAREHGREEVKALLSDGPVDRPRD